jgi:hypothetical protein
VIASQQHIVVLERKGTRMATVVGSKRKEEKGTAAYSTAPFPLGFKFSPSDEQLVDHYLRLKNEGCESEVQIIGEVDVYNYEPWDLPGTFFFFLLLRQVNFLFIDFSFYVLAKCRVVGNKVGPTGVVLLLPD